MSADPRRYGPALASLVQRELLRFIRQRSRVISALAQPVVFWVLFGAGLSGSFKLEGSPGLEFAEFFFPGTLTLIALFTALFSTMSVIEDRQSGFTQALLVAPVPPLLIASSKIIGSTLLALGQALLFYVLAPLADIPLGVVPLLATTAALLLVCVALSATALAIAWPMDSPQGFHAVMMLVLVPMWLVSGAFFPAEGASPLLGALMSLNPLTYGVGLIRHALYAGQEQVVGGPTVVASLVVSALTAALAVAVATRRVARSGMEEGR